MLFGQWAEPTAANGTRIRRVGAMDEATGTLNLLARWRWLTNLRYSPASATVIIIFIAIKPYTTSDKGYF
jgi:hypothetical protein